MFDYQVGGNAVPMDASEAMAQISMNRSLFVQKLTANDPIKPEAVYDLKTVDEVFDHFKPNIEVELEKPDGTTSEETIHFNGISDFKPSNVVAQSPLLTDLSNQKDDYQKIIKQLKTNKLVKGAIENPDTKAAFMNALQSLIQELEEHK